MGTGAMHEIELKRDLADFAAEEQVLENPDFES